MADYIDREAAVKETCFNCSERNICGGSCDDTDRIRAIPAADVRPNVKSGWHIMDGYPPRVYCLNCYKTFAQANWEIWEDGSLPRNFCPNCGADMDGGQDDV